MPFFFPRHLWGCQNCCYSQPTKPSCLHLIVLEANEPAFLSTRIFLFLFFLFAHRSYTTHVIVLFTLFFSQRERSELPFFPASLRILLIVRFPFDIIGRTFPPGGPSFVLETKSFFFSESLAEFFFCTCTPVVCCLHVELELVPRRSERTRPGGTYFARAIRRGQQLRSHTTMLCCIFLKVARA